MNGTDNKSFSDHLEIYFKELIAPTQLINKKGSEINDFKELLGAGAHTWYMESGCSLQTWKNNTKGVLSYGGNEYLVIRHGSRSWEVSAEGLSWRFGSQWELLAWFGDRL